jgi:zeta-carotene desaturase
MSPSPDVIVIGAGIAGLAAATSLAAAGAQVLVLEARGLLGGRASSFRHAPTGSEIDNGQHVVLGCYHETFAYLERVGAAHAVAMQDRLEVPVVDSDGTSSVLRCPAWPSPWHLLAGVLRWQGLGVRDRLSVLRLAPALRVAAESARLGIAPSPVLEQKTVEQWLRRHGQTARLRELLWEPLAVAALNQPVDVAAAAPFVRVLGGVFGPDPRDSSIGIPVKPLTAVFGQPARVFLEQRGGAVRVHAPARLEFNGARPLVTVRGVQVHTAAIVVAVPWGAWRTLVDERRARDSGLGPVLDAARARVSSPIVSVHLWLPRPVVHGPFVGLPGRIFQWAFEREVPQGAHIVLVSSGVMAVARQPDAVTVAHAWRELSGALPEASRMAPVHAQVVRERHATFSLAPGQPPRSPMRTAIPSLWLAGDWTDTGLPATLEGAALSGHRVAAALIAERDTR